MTSRWLTLAAFVLAWSLVLGAGPAGTSVGATKLSPGDPGRVGISTSTVWLSPQEGYAYLAHARQGGVTWIREDFSWNEVEKVAGHFTWGRTDALMRNAARLRMNVLPVVAYTPAWASGHADSKKYPPTDPTDYANFAKAVADRYGRGGKFWRLNPRLPPAPLTAIELWNEPWLTEFWRSGPDPVAYARLVRAAATAVKAGHPRITVLASGDVPEETEGVGPDWFRSALLADPDLWRSGLVGAWSVHLYCHELSPWDATAPQRARFDRLLLTLDLAHEIGADKPIWITEFGWRTDAESHDSVSEQTQAEYTREALLRIAAQWGSVVRRSFVYTWAKGSADDPYNLIRPDGSTRPAWQAIQAVIASGADPRQAPS